MSTKLDCNKNTTVPLLFIMLDKSNVNSLPLFQLIGNS